MLAIALALLTLALLLAGLLALTLLALLTLLTLTVLALLLRLSAARTHLLFEAFAELALLVSNLMVR